MKRIPPFFPIVALAFPVLAMYAKNAANVPVGDLWRPLAVACLVAAVLWAILSVIFRSIEKGAIFAALVTILFFAHDPIRSVMDPYDANVLEPIAVLIAAVLLFRTKANLRGITAALNFGSIVLLVSPLFQLAKDHPSQSHIAYLDPKLPLRSASLKAQQPDIFFIIVDGYGRADQLKRVMGFDNGPFLEQLRSRGFFVADRAHSNYVQTQLSLAATLNLSFLQDFPQVFPSSSKDRTPLEDAIRNSFVAKYFKSRGYAIVGVTTGFAQVDFTADVLYDRPTKLSLLETTLLQITPIRYSDVASPIFIERRSLLNGALDNLAHLSASAGRPKLVLAHILAPHPPFVFDARGNPVQQKDVSLGFADGSDYMHFGGTRQKYIDGYTGQVQWLNRRLLEVIDSILPRSGKRPVIIIEGDHGSKTGLDQADINKSDLHEAFSNLIAIEAPSVVQQRLYPEMTSANTFRILLSALFDEPVPNLPDRSFYSPFNQPYRFTEVTDRVKP